MQTEYQNCWIAGLDAAGAGPGGAVLLPPPAVAFAAAAAGVPSQLSPHGEGRSQRNPDAAVPRTMAAAATAAMMEGRWRRKSQVRAMTSGIPSRLRSVCVSPAVCGCEIAMKKLPVPLKRPMMMRKYHGGERDAEAGAVAAPPPLGASASGSTRVYSVTGSPSSEIALPPLAVVSLRRFTQLTMARPRRNTVETMP